MNSSTSSFERLKFMAAGFAVTLALLGGAGEGYLRAKVVPQDLFWRHVDLFSSSKTPDAAFGDSHMARGFPGTAQVINLAYPGASLGDIRATIEAYYKDKKPGRVILQASPQFFAKHADEGTRDITAILHGLYLLDDYYRIRLIEHLRHTPDDFDKATVFQPYGGILTQHDVSQTYKMKAFKDAVLKTAKAETPPPGFAGEPAAALYRDTAQWLAEHGAQVCMVTMPVMPAFRAAAQADDVFAYFRIVAHDTKAKYVSYWSAFDDPRFFINGDHLSAAGAERLSPRMLNDCFE